MKLIPIFLLYTLCFAPLSSLAAFTVETSPDDYFRIVFLWPKAQCASQEGCCPPKKGNPILNDFVISELQPIYTTWGNIQDCNSTTKFQSSKIADLVPSLKRNWPSLTCPSRDSKKLWSEEWYKYGTSSEPYFNQHDYYAADGGVKPNGTYYSAEQINKVIKKAGLGEGFVSCEKDKNGLFTILDRVTLCGSVKGNKCACPGNNIWICDSRNGNAVKFPSPIG